MPKGCLEPNTVLLDQSCGVTLRKLFLRACNSVTLAVSSNTTPQGCCPRDGCCWGWFPRRDWQVTVGSPLWGCSATTHLGGLKALQAYWGFLPWAASCQAWCSQEVCCSSSGQLRSHPGVDCLRSEDITTGICGWQLQDSTLQHFFSKVEACQECRVANGSGYDA